MSNLNYPIKRFEAMPPSSRGSRILWRWGNTSNNRGVPMPAMAYYFSMPEDARCVFSLNDQITKPRHFDRMGCPDRKPVAWDNDRIEKEAQSLRDKYPDEALKVFRPNTWEDLYLYFDPHDLWLQGAWNLWCVIDLLGEQNAEPAFFTQTRLKNRPRCDRRHERFAIVDDWVWRWLTTEQNREKISTWNHQTDILYQLWPEDWMSIGKDGLLPDELERLRDQLLFWHHQYYCVSKVKLPRRAQSCSGQMVTISDVHQWMGCCFDEETYNLQGSADAVDVAEPEARAISVPPSSILPKHNSDIATRPSTSAGVSNRQLVYSAVMNGTIEGTAYQTTVISPSGLEPSKETRQPKTHHKGSKSGPVIPVPVDADVANRGAGVEKSGPSRLPSRSMQPPAEEKTSTDLQPLDVSNHALDLETTARAASHQSKPSHESVTSGKSVVSQDVSHKSPDSVESRVHNNNITHMPTHGLLAHSRLTSAESQRQRTWEACKNARRDGRAYSKQYRHRAYVECGCQRCARASRSVWVSNFMPNLDKKRTIQLLNRFFSQWGNVEYCELKSAEKGYPYAIVQYTSEVSAQQALHAAHGVPVLYVSNALQTKFPFYSKYYKEFPRPGFVARVSPPRAPPGINFNGAKGQDAHQHHARMSTSPPFAGHPKHLEHSTVPASSLHCYHTTPNAAYHTPPKQSPPGVYSPINGRGPLAVSPQFSKSRPQQTGLYRSSLPTNYDANIDGPSPPRAFTWQLSLEHSSSTRPAQGFANGSPPSMMGPNSMPAYVQGALNSVSTQALTPKAAPWFPSGRQSAGANIPVPKPVQSVQTREPLDQSSPVNRKSPDSMNSRIDFIRVRLPSMSPEMQFASTGTEPDSPKVSGEPATPEKQDSSSVDPAIVTDSEAAPGSLFALPPTSRFGQGDIRLELDYSATVIRRKNKYVRPIPSLWTSGVEVEEGQAIQKKASSKKKNNKQGRGSVSRPSTPTNHEQEAQAAGEDYANNHVPINNNKGYRAGAGGSLRMPRKRPCPALNTLYAQESVPIAGASNHAMVSTGSQGEVDKPNPVAEDASKKKEYGPHGSFRNLPKGFDPFPRADIESIKSLPPIVLTAPSEPKHECNAPPVVGEHLNAGHRPSTSSTAAQSHRTSYLEAQRRLPSSSGSPKSDDDQLFVSAPQPPLVDEHDASSATLSVNARPIPTGITASHASSTNPEQLADCKNKNKGKEPIRDDGTKNIDSAVAPKPTMVGETADKHEVNRTLSNKVEKKKPAAAHDSRSLSKVEEKKSKSSNSNAQEGNLQPSNKAEGKKTHVSQKADKKTRSRSSTPTEFGRKIERRNGQRSNNTGERSRPSTPTQLSDKTDEKAKSVTAAQLIIEAKENGKASFAAQPSTKAEVKKPEPSTGAPSADKDVKKKSQPLQTAETQPINDAESNERSSSDPKTENKSKPSASTPTQGAGDSREKHRPSAPAPLSVQGEKKPMPSTSDQPAAKAEQKPVGLLLSISPQTSPRKKNKKLNKRLNLAKRKRTEASAATVPGAASL